MPETIDILRADYHNASHAKAVSYLLNCYAEDPMGGGKPLSLEVKTNLAAKLAEQGNAFSVLCYVDGQATGLINCFFGFSTFKCKPLVYIHDVVVIGNHRGLGLSQKMLDEVERIAREKECCKLTLEVLEGNEIAKNAYLKFGFSGYELDPKMGKALFWEKVL
jgi:ribosomal protein S18 acetylase RimI-like enzyme